MNTYFEKFFAVLGSVLIHLALFLVLLKVYNTSKYSNPKPLIVEISLEPAIFSEKKKFTKDVARPDIKKSDTVKKSVEEDKPLDQGIEKVSESTDNSETDNKIDERSIYKESDSLSSQEDRASLEMEGWTWDFEPQVIDMTDETGKIVFQITVDTSGYIVGIKELEKTISPQLATVYRDALKEITFSRTSSEEMVSNTNTTNGKVTFIISSK